VTYDQCVPLLAIAALRDKSSVMKILNEIQEIQRIYYSLLIIIELFTKTTYRSSERVIIYLCSENRQISEADVDMNKTKSLIFIYSFIFNIPL
jgi:hypothetical protein